MLEILTNTESLRALEPEWRALWRRAGSPPFQSPDWLLPWWSAFGTPHLRAATLRQDGTLLALLPAYLLDESPERKLLPVGIGITDYLDALLDPSAPPGTAGGLLAALLAQKEDGITSAAFPDLPPGAALLGALCPPGWAEQLLPCEPCPVLDPALIPAGMQRNIRQSRNRADRAGGWSLDSAPDPAAAWKELDRLHAGRWSGNGEPGVLADPAVRAFHAAALPLLAAAGTLRMHLLRIAGDVAAAYYTLAAPGRLYFYLSGFDPAHRFVSPGTLLLGELAARCLADGTAELHFLRGREPYKYAWGAIDRPNAGRVFTPG